MTKSVGGRSKAWQPCGPPRPARAHKFPARVVRCVTESFNKADGLGWDYDLAWEPIVGKTLTFGTSGGEAGLPVSYQDGIGTLVNSVTYDDMLVSVTITAMATPGASTYQNVTLIARYKKYTSPANSEGQHYFGQFVINSTYTRVYSNVDFGYETRFYEIAASAPAVKVGDRLGYEVTGGGSSDVIARAFINNVEVATANMTQLVADDGPLLNPEDLTPVGRSAGLWLTGAIAGVPSTYKPAYTLRVDDFSVCPA